jgi:thiamine kinase-like enzyme
MSKQYLGHLPTQDPLHSYLQNEILPQVGCSNSSANFRVFHLSGSNEVYLYEERHSQARVVGKFFAGNGVGATGQRMQQEFHNLHLLRGYGLAHNPHSIVRPLGCNGWLNNVLVEEYCNGQSLSNVITNALFHGQQDALYSKLTALAYFLATLHNRTANGYGVNFHEDCAYLDHLVRKLLRRNFINGDEANELYWLRDRWREQPRMWEDQQVLVHGDATPSNFLFGYGLDVIAIDLERMKRADRVFDVGRIAGELQHSFLQATGNKYAAEPWIGHFLWEYSCHFPDRDSAFRSITGRLPFQMGLTLLRIARNSWVSSAYRRRLIEEAKITLRTF